MKMFHCVSKMIFNTIGAFVHHQKKKKHEKVCQVKTVMSKMCNVSLNVVKGKMESVRMQYPFWILILFYFVLFCFVSKKKIFFFV